MAVKRELVIVNRKQGFYEIKYEGGGHLPDSLVGIFTKRANAQTAIDRHIASKPKPRFKKEVVTDATESTTTD